MEVLIIYDYFSSPVLSKEIKHVQGYLKFQRTVLKMTVLITGLAVFCYRNVFFMQENVVKEKNHAK